MKCPHCNKKIKTSITYYDAYVQRCEEFKRQTELNGGIAPGIMPSFDMFKSEMIRQGKFLPED